MRSLAFLMPKRRLKGITVQQRYGIFAPRNKNLSRVSFYSRLPSILCRPEGREGDKENTIMVTACYWQPKI